MNEQTTNTNAAFMEVTSRKVDGQDKKIDLLEGKIKSIHDNTGVMQKLIGVIEELRNDVKNSRFPEEKVDDFSTRLDFGIRLLSHPVENKIVHHHHVHKIIWIAAGLFVALALVCASWYMTGDKLDNYITNDTKYRYLRLDTTQRGLQFYLDRIDSLYNAYPDMRKIVLETEEEYHINFEKLQKAEWLKAEAKDLEKSATKK